VVDIINIIYHPNFEKELRKILKKFSGNKTEILDSLNHNLKILERFGKKAIVEPQFELLKGSSKKIHSLRLIKGTPNLRVLFCFLNNNEVILLAIFYEKGKNDYRSAIKIAEERFRNYYY